MTLEHKKYEIIQEIMSITQEEIIISLENALKNIARPKYRLDLSEHPDIKEKVDIDEIMEERQLIDFDMSEFVKEASSLEWDKSTEELLAELD